MLKNVTASAKSPIRGRVAFHKRAPLQRTDRAYPTRLSQPMCGKNERPSMYRKPKFRRWLGALVVAASVLQAVTVVAAPVRAKWHHIRPWHGYGFLPGYR